MGVRDSDRTNRREVVSVGETEFVKLCQNGKEAAGRTEGNNVKKRMFQEKKKNTFGSKV